MSIVIYQKPTCTTCRQVYAALKETGVDLAERDSSDEAIIDVTIERRT